MWPGPRTEVHDTLFREIDEHLEAAGPLRARVRKRLAGVRGRGDRTSEWTRLKALPRRATLGNLRDLEEHLAWLLSLGDVEGVLVGLSAAKIKDFAAEARALAPTEMATVPARKRQAFAPYLVGAGPSDHDADQAHAHDRRQSPSRPG